MFTVKSWISSRLISTAMVFSVRKYNYYFVAELLRHPVCVGRIGKKPVYIHYTPLNRVISGPGHFDPIKRNKGVGPINRWLY